MKICSGMAQLVERWVTERTCSGPITIDKPTLRVFVSRWNMIVLVIVILSRLLLRVTDITTTYAVVIFRDKVSYITLIYYTHPDGHIPPTYGMTPACKPFTVLLRVLQNT